MNNTPTVAISDLAEVNPTTSVSHRGIASFVGMEDVSQNFALTRTSDRHVSRSSGYTRFQDDDLLFAKITPCMENGKGAYVTGLTNGIGFGSTEFHVLRARQNGVPRFLAQWLRNMDLRRAAETQMTGSAGQRRVPADFFSRYRIPFLSIPEQRRIAEILDTLDDEIRATEQIIAKLHLVTHGLLVDVFQNGIDEAGTKRDPQCYPRQFKESPLGPIPRCWQVGPASKWCDRLTVGVVNSATHAYAQDGVPFIRSQNVKPNQIDARDLIYVTDAFNRQQTKSILRAGDVVIVRTGYPGTAAVVPPSLEGSNCFSLVVASPNTDLLTSEFMARYLNSPTCARQINRLHFGSAQHNFNVGEMKALPLPRPPIDEQARIVSVLRDQESLHAANEDLLAKLKKIKYGLASDLLSGRIQPPVRQNS